MISNDLKKIVNDIVDGTVHPVYYNEIEGNLGYNVFIECLEYELDLREAQVYKKFDEYDKCLTEKYRLRYKAKGEVSTQEIDDIKHRCYLASEELDKIKELYYECKAFILKEISDRIAEMHIAKNQTIEEEKAAGKYNGFIDYLQNLSLAELYDDNSPVCYNLIERIRNKVEEKRLIYAYSEEASAEINV